MKDYTKMTLLTESFNVVNTTKETVLNENTNKNETLYFIEGIFSTPDEKNANGRIYPLKLWEEEVAKYQLHLQNDGSLNSYGEYEHPPRSTVEKDKAVIQIKELYIKDGLVYGKALILKGTDRTHELENAIDNNQTIGVSSRGLGVVGDDNVVTEFMLITYDAVKEPSDYNAHLNGYTSSNITESEDDTNEISKLKAIIAQKDEEIQALKDDNKKDVEEMKYVNESIHKEFKEKMNLVSEFLDEKLQMMESRIVNNLDLFLNDSLNESIVEKVEPKDRKLDKVYDSKMDIFEVLSKLSEN